MTSHKVIFLMGPTAIGKTNAALAIAERFPVEIISVDSMMVYRSMNIGTHKPSLSVRKIFPHYLVDIRNPNEFYSAGDFVRDSSSLIQAITKKNHIPLFVGGTMLYFRALQFGLSRLPTRDETIRQRLLQQVKENGLEILYQELCKVDKESAKRILPNDPQRLLRALEVYYSSGKPLSVLQKEEKRQPFDGEFFLIGLYPAERKTLHHKIEQRFHTMLKQGFLEEVRSLMESKELPLDVPAARGVGYRQALQYLTNTIDYDSMVTQAITATRHLAKRQMTWMNNWPSDIHKIIVEKEQTYFSQLHECIEKLIIYDTRHTTLYHHPEHQISS